MFSIKLILQYAYDFEFELEHNKNGQISKWNASGKKWKKKKTKRPQKLN